MVKKIYGKHVYNYKWCNGSALVDRTLEIYKTKTSLKGVLWNSGVKGWREEPHKPIGEFKYDLSVGEHNALVMIATHFDVPESATKEKVYHNYGTIK